jgi:hypothetical protein
MSHASSPHTFYVTSSVYGRLGWFYSLSMVSGTDVNTGLQMSIMHADLCFFRYMLKSGLVGSYGSSVFSLLRLLHVDFHSDCTNLHSYQWCISVAFPPTSLPTLTVICFLNDCYSDWSKAES